MMWEACAEKVKEMGGDIRMGCKVVGCHYDAEAGLWTDHLRRRGKAHDT